MWRRSLRWGCWWGFGSGGFAHTIATGEPHALNAPFALDRFTTGALIDEHGAAAVAH
ncbi:sarcosine oxidase subunit beta [Streptomyces acidiscabies]|nr:sarcosine oxidase subunit beta [Streptomyces acidiscabies]